MANLKEIRTRIGSVKNTQKITRAMKLVSAAKFAKAGAAAKGAAPYSDGLDRLVKQISTSAGDMISSELFSTREEKRATVIMVSTDRGLCGGLNANLFKKFLKFAEEKKNVQVEVMSLGKKANAFFRNNKRSNVKVVTQKEKVLEKPSNDFARELMNELSEKFKKLETDAVYLIYPKFESALSQVPVIDKLLPIDPKSLQGESETKESIDYLVEPTPETVLNSLLVKQLTNKIFRAFLESSASEHGARMTAMDSATNNASDVINGLTLQYNRGRQAAITKELIEITSGAEAL